MTAEDSDHVWSQWWDIQDSLCHDMDTRIEQDMAGRSGQFGAALVASLIEHLAEKQRVYLRLPASDFREAPDG